MDSLNVLIITFVTNMVNTLVTWFLSKRKYGAEVDQAVIKNMQESLNFYKNMCDDMNKRLELYAEENNKLRDELADMRKRLFDLMSKLSKGDCNEVF